MDNIEYIKDVLTALKSELIRYRALAALLFTVIFAGVLFVSIKWPKYYESSAAIVIDNAQIIEPLMRGKAALANVDKTQKPQDIMYSRRIMEKVLQRIDPDFDDLTPEDLQDRVAFLRSRLAISEPDKKNVTYVSFRAPTADEAFDTLSVLIDVFIADRHAEKQKETHEATAFLGDYADRYKRLLEEAEQRLKEFKARTVDASEETVRGKIQNLTTEIQNLKIAINETEETIRTTRTQLEAESENLGARIQVQSMEERRTTLIAERDRLKMIYQDNYPDILTLNEQIGAIDKSIADIRSRHGWSIANSSEMPLHEELRKQLSAAEVNLKTQTRRLRALEGLLEDEYKLANEVAGNQAELTELTRDYELYKKSYDEFMTMREKAKLTQALTDEGQGETYKLVEPPVYPITAAGIPSLYVFVAAPFVAFLAPVGLALAYVILDPRIRSHTVLAHKLPEGIQVLGAVPHRGSPLAARLLRKDMLLMVMLAFMLLALYIYVFVTIRPNLV